MKNYIAKTLIIRPFRRALFFAFLLFFKLSRGCGLSRAAVGGKNADEKNLKKF